MRGAMLMGRLKDELGARLDGRGALVEDLYWRLNRAFRTVP